MSHPVRPMGKKILHSGWGTLSAHEIDFTRRDGAIQRLHREVYDHGNAAAVLLIDRDARAITLVRQFRLPAMLNGDSAMLLEVAAGLLDGDAPEACANKEALEETGIAPKTLLHAFDLYASPGSLTEKVHCFIGFYDETSRIGAGGGIDHEGEDIEIVTLPAANALTMTRNGAIIDAKTVALIQFAALEGFL